MPIEILDAVLSFSINGFVKLFPDSRAFFFCFPVVSIDISHHDCEHLSSLPERRRALSALARTSQHDICLAHIHLNAAYRLAVTVVLRESEYPRQPVTSISHIAVHKIRRSSDLRNGAVIHGDSILRVCTCVQGRRCIAPSCERPSTGKVIHGPDKCRNRKLPHCPKKTPPFALLSETGTAAWLEGTFAVSPLIPPRNERPSPAVASRDRRERNQPREPELIVSPSARRGR